MADLNNLGIKAQISSVSAQSVSPITKSVSDANGTREETTYEVTIKDPGSRGVGDVKVIYDPKTKQFTSSDPRVSISTDKDGKPLLRYDMNKERSMAAGENPMTMQLEAAQDFRLDTESVEKLIKPLEQAKGVGGRDGHSFPVTSVKPETKPTAIPPVVPAPTQVDPVKPRQETGRVPTNPEKPKQTAEDGNFMNKLLEKIMELFSGFMGGGKKENDAAPATPQAPAPRTALPPTDIPEDGFRPSPLPNVVAASASVAPTRRP